ncbi:Protein of unknown function, partial [Gryllus bimaculatus]
RAATLGATRGTNGAPAGPGN